MSDVLHLTDENFETEVMQSDIPVLVDFSATWCGPCQALAPAIDEMTKEFEGKVFIAKVDVEAPP